MRSTKLVIWYILILMFLAEAVIYVFAGFAADYCFESRRRQFNSEAVTWQEIVNVPYAGLINEMSRKEGVSARVVSAVINAESSFNPQALSPAGAAGLMQVTPATWRDINTDIKACDNRHSGECTALCYFNPEINIRIGINYLSRLVKRYDGNLVLAISAYNAGPAAVDKCGGIPVNGETEKYVDQVISNWYDYGQQSEDTTKTAQRFKKWRQLAFGGMLMTTAVIIFMLRNLKQRYHSWRWR